MEIITVITYVLGAYNIFKLSQSAYGILFKGKTVDMSEYNIEVKKPRPRR